MFDLTNKVALVTGSSRGLGEGVALGLARSGADVVVNSLPSHDEGEKVARQIRELGRKAIYVAADVSNEADVRAMFTTIQEHFGRLDILVNNAGTTRAEDIFETTLESWNSIMGTNMTSAFLCSKYAMEMMKNQRSGRIIQMSSMVAHQGAIYGHVHYAASKGALLSFTKTLARTAAPYGITVNAIAPGMIETDLLHQTHSQQKLAEFNDRIPLGLGQVEDVAAAAVFLSSDEARFITGNTIDVNGGQYFR